MQVVNVGVTAIRSVFTADQVPGILVAYMDGLKVVFALSIALVGISFMLGLLPKYEKLRPGYEKTTKGEASTV